MKSSIVIGGAVVALALGAVLVARAGSGDAVLPKASGLVWEMTEWHREFSDHRLARGITPDAERALAESTAAKLAAQRDKLEALVSKLPPGTRFTADLTKFVQTWSTRDIFLHDLLGDAHGEQSGLAIASLAMQVTDPRRGWKTLFPLFRP
jgi:hypothetical protein